jgi:hypothetical protein
VSIHPTSFGEITSTVMERGARRRIPLHGSRVASASGSLRQSHGAQRLLRTLSSWNSAWLRENRSIKLVDLIVRQSSDAAFHCFTIVVFYRR